jgi:hypothetical protein
MARAAAGLALELLLDDGEITRLFDWALYTFRRAIGWNRA